MEGVTLIGKVSMTSKRYDVSDKRVQYLIRTDKRLGALIKYIGNIELCIERDGFSCLMKYIIGQQISDKARETIWQRVRINIGNITPSNILSLSDCELENTGISNRKVEYIKILATGVVEKKINYKKLETLQNEEVIANLITLKGIGRWTAEMYLIFSLGRENVLSKGDGTIRRTIQWMYDLEKLPSSDELKEYFSEWMEFATIVSLYLWKAIALGLTQKPFGNIISNWEKKRE